MNLKVNIVYENYLKGTENLQEDINIDLKNRNVLKELGIDDDTLFNENTQDKIAVHLAERRVRQKFSMTEARKEMRNECKRFEKQKI